jgi:long-chain acyl-CoA synthetase
MVVSVQVAAIHLTPQLFSVENGLMTPTFKLKRPQAAAAFQDNIDAMYQAIKQ